MKTKVKNILINFSSVITILIIWFLISYCTNAELVFPYPSQVVKSIVELVTTTSFWTLFLHSFIRVIISVLITFFSGVFIGILCGLFSSFNQFCKIPVSIIRTTPVIAVILMAMFWFKSSQVPVFVSVLMSFPVMLSAVQKGFDEKNDEQFKTLLNMSKVYRFGFFKEFMTIRVPHAVPFIFTGIQSVFGMTWKVVCAGEVLSLPKYSIGKLMHSSQLHLESAELIAITILIVTASFIGEQILLFFMKKINNHIEI